MNKIDHFMCSERLFSFIEQSSPIQSGDNFSRHSPIVLTLLPVNDIPRSVTVNVDFPWQGKDRPYQLVHRATSQQNPGTY